LRTPRRATYCYISITAHTAQRDRILQWLAHEATRAHTMDSDDSVVVIVRAICFHADRLL